ncbi:hypothetical protein PG994_009509 [Apiospora phragmitis]|uniref:Fucose-specific lectin n=1 Tax=Apiospora phragmitis TaxID=2905665 RepID=A0ABR1U6V2_9PEZI
MQSTSGVQIPRRPQFGSVDYNRHARSGDRIDKASDLEVKGADGALEVNNEHEGIEVHSPIDWEPRASIPVSALAELASNKSHLATSNSNIVGEWPPSGAVTGSLLSRKPHQAPTPLSNLAAVNWTTAANVTIYVVFSQEADGSLIAHRQENGGWGPVNISQIFQESGISLGIRAGTPLTATAISNPARKADQTVNELSLFYLTPSNNITQIVTHDDSLTEWEWGDIGPHSDVKLSAAPGSQLSAAWQRCHNATAGCGDGTLSLTFEDEHQNYLVANSTYNWTATVASGRLAANSSMALISMDYGNASDYLWGFFSTNGVMGSTWQDFQNGNWWWTNLGRNIMYDIPPSVSQGFAAVSFRGRTCALVAALVKDGSVKVKYWDPLINDWHSEEKIKLLNESAETGFITIAMTPDARLYGKANSGTIQELRMDQDDPYSFSLRGGCCMSSLA